MTVDTLNSQDGTPRSTSPYRPNDDLFRYVNHHWLDTHKIPDDRPADGPFYQLRDTSLEQLRGIIEQLPTGDRIADLYASFMDEEKRNAAGSSPISPLLSLIHTCTSIPDIMKLSGLLSYHGVAGLVGLYVAADSKDTTQYALYLSQSGLSLPDESYYHNDQFAAIKKQCEEHIATMFSLCGIDSGLAAEVIKLEDQIAQQHWSKVDCRDADKTYNPYSLDDFVALAPSLDLSQWAEEHHCPASVDRIIVMQPSFFAGLESVAKNTTLPQWKSWLTWKVIASFAGVLSENIAAENFRFYGTVLSGSTEMKPLWKRGVGIVESVLGFELGKHYVDKYFSATARQEINALVSNLIAAYRHNIEKLDWMTESTKTKALAKLAAFTPKVGAPTSWRSYEELPISPHNIVGNLMVSAAFDHDFDYAKLGKPVDKDEWLMTPQTVNAYYYPEHNEIVFPAAILQPPFFDPAGDPAANFGGIGAVIGHEIGHGFDDQGAKYDGNGMLQDWWTEKDKSEFTIRTQKLIEQYDSYIVSTVPDQHVNGALTVGENIGDLGGLSIALVAFELAQGRVLTQEEKQRVFISWARIWCAKTRPEYQRMLLAVDPHSPAEWRCNGAVRNIAAFYEAFDVTEEDHLFLPEDQRVSIW